MRYRSDETAVKEPLDPRTDLGPGDGGILGRLVIVLAAFVCLFFVTGLRDTLLLRSLAELALAPLLAAPGTERDAELHVAVVDEADRPLAAASVRVFAMREGRAFFAGDRNADRNGAAEFKKLPRGDVWILGYGAGRARASAQALLVAGTRSIRLVLQPARALDAVVVDEADHLVEGATVEVRTADPLPYAAITGKDGAARVDRLGPPPYRLRVSARGFDDVNRTGVVPGPSPIRIRLERPGALVVAVAASDGSPAVGATVLAAGTGLWPARSTVVDDHGVTQITGLRGGVYELRAQRGNDVSRTEVAVAVKRGERKEVKLTLAPGKRVRVLVTDGAGTDAPVVKQASVVLVEEGISSFPLVGRTDDKGLVELGPIEKLRATLVARAPGFVPRTVAVEAAATEARVSLVRGGSLSGDVVDDRGFPVAGATIEVVGVDGEGLPIDETSTMTDFRDQRFEATLAGPVPLIPMGELGVMPGPVPDFSHEAVLGTVPPERPTPGRQRGEPWVTRSDGTFRATPIPPGRVHAIVRHPSWVEAISDAVTIRSGMDTTVHIVLRQGGWIEGRVIEEDRTPVRGARIELAATRGSLERVAYAGDDGTFTFPAAPDEVLLSVSRPDGLADVVAQVLVSVPERDRRKVEIVLPKLRATVGIRVTDDRGYPVGRVEVRTVSLDIADPLRRTLFTNDNGECELHGGLGLALRFTLVRPGKAPLVRVVDSAPPQITFAMGEGIEGRGHVTGRDGRDRLSGVQVTVFTNAGARHVRTDGEGEFVVKDLAPGRVRLSLNHPSYAPAESVVVVVGARDRPADLGTVDLLEAGEVEGTVVDANDEPVAGARVARDGVPTYLPLGPLPNGITASDREGHFKLGGLPEGSVVLEAYISDLGRARAEGVVVRAGRTTDRVKITLPGGPSTKEPKGAGSVAVTLGERSSDKVVVVALVSAGSEAEAAGIEPGDEVVTINGHPVHSIEGARNGLTGPLGEDVVVELRRGDEPLSRLRVRRERVRR